MKSLSQTVDVNSPDMSSPLLVEAGLTELATANPYYNPAPVKKDALRRLLQNAYDGRPPEPYLS